jgi:hypothetical protein
MRNLTVKKTVKCEFTPSQWELYVTSFDEAELKPVADDLNRSLEILLNGDYERSFVYQQMEEELRRHSKYGAYDSEPIRFMERVLNHVWEK